MTISIPATTKPGMVTAVAVMTLISGIINIIAGLTIAAALALSIVLICIAPLGILPIVLGVFEIIYAIKLLATPPQPVRPNQTIAILEIVCVLFGNILSAIIGILALVFYNDPAVKAYFAMINGQPAPIPPSTPAVPPASPVPPVVTEPERPQPTAQPVLLAAAVPEPQVEASQPVAPVASQAKPVKAPAKAKPAAPKSTKTAPKAKASKPAQGPKTKAATSKTEAKPAKPKAKKPTG